MTFTTRIPRSFLRRGTAVLIGVALALPLDAAAAWTRPLPRSPAWPMTQALGAPFMSAHREILGDFLDVLFEYASLRPDKAAIKSSLLQEFNVSHVHGIRWVDVEYLRAAYLCFGELGAKEGFAVSHVYRLWLVPWYLSLPARILRSTRQVLMRGHTVWLIAYRNPRRFEQEVIRQLVDATRTAKTDAYARDRWTSVQEKPWLAYVAGAETVLAGTLAALTILHFSSSLRYGIAFLVLGATWSSISGGWVDRFFDIWTKKEAFVLDPMKDVFVSPLAGVYSLDRDVTHRLAARVDARVPFKFEAPPRKTWRPVFLGGAMAILLSGLPSRTLAWVLAVLFTAWTASTLSSLWAWGGRVLRRVLPEWPRRPPTSALGRRTGTVAAFALALAFELGRWLMPFAFAWTASHAHLLQSAA